MLYKVFYGFMTIVYALVVVIVGCFTLYKLGVEGNPAYVIPFLIFWQFTKKRALAAIGLKAPVHRNVLGEIATAYKAAEAKRVAEEGK
jgi:hypothetical protein